MTGVRPGGCLAIIDVWRAQRETAIEVAIYRTMVDAQVAIAHVKKSIWARIGWDLLAQSVLHSHYQGAS